MQSDCIVGLQLLQEFEGAILVDAVIGKGMNGNDALERRNGTVDQLPLKIIKRLPYVQSRQSSLDQEQMRVAISAMRQFRGKENMVHKAPDSFPFRHRSIVCRS
jgi:hypothetical protein